LLGDGVIDGARRGALFGAVIGAVVGVAMYLMRKKREGSSRRRVSLAGRGHILRLMPITKDTVAHIDYTLTGPDGTVIDSSEGREPLPYLHGAGNIIPGLEAELEGKSAGDAFTVSIPPAQAYGDRDERQVQSVPRAAFQGVPDIQPGMQFQARGPQGQQKLVTVRAVTNELITVDGNHPLAGLTLTFAVKVVNLRPATPEELAHGHVHGPGGHHHH
jgi:FKBP-type peptidyl-prolyl cis-trans isomerase SlyD